MAKARKKEEKKSDIALRAARAGKIAAKAEQLAREAVERAMHASSLVVGAIGRPAHTVKEIGAVAAAGQDAVTKLVDERLRATIAGLGLATREDVAKLTARVAALEKKAKAAPGKKPAARKTPKGVPAKNAPARG